MGRGRELAVPGTAEERVPLRPGEDQGRAARVPGVAHRHLTAGQERDLHAVPPGWPAALAPQPGQAGQVGSWHAVAVHAHRDPSKLPSMDWTILADSLGVALSLLSLSIAAAYRATSGALSRYRALVSCST